MRTRDASVATMIVWVFLVAGLAVLARSVNLEVVFVLFLLSLLAVTELTDTVYARPRHLLAMRIVIAVGVVLFGVLIAHKVMVILSS